MQAETQPPVQSQPPICPRCNWILDLKREYPTCIRCGFVDYEYNPFSTPPAAKEPKSRYGREKPYTIPYRGKRKACAEKFMHVKTFHDDIREVYEVYCPICEKTEDNEYVAMLLLFARPDNMRIYQCEQEPQHTATLIIAHGVPAYWE